MKLKDGQISLSTSQDRKTYIKLRKLLDKGLDLAGNNWNWPIAGYLTLPTMQRILNLAWIYDLQIKSSGCIMEFGVHFGSAFAQLINLRSMLEPYNFSRHIHGFDTFEGFPELSNKDISKNSDHVKVGDLSADTYEELIGLSEIHDSTRYLGHIPKVKLIKGNAVNTIPSFIEDHPHLLVSLLYLDFDLYEPTKIALESFFPLMPKGAVIVFDELDNPLWPGETKAMLEFCNDMKLQIERLPYDPYVGFAVIK